MSKPVSLIAACLVLLSACRTAENARREELATRLLSVMEQFHASSNFPGAVISAWFAGDSSTVVSSVGTTDRDSTPMPLDARLHAGSVGKTFYAALALQLVGEGRMALDEKVSHYLGSEPWYAKLPNAGDVTIRMLLNHTSGLPEYGSDFMVDLIRDPGRARAPLDAVQSVLGARAEHPAGERFRYSDVNYQLLQLAMERVMHTPAAQEIHRRFLAPLRLTNTVAAEQPVIPGLVPGFAGRESFMGFDAVMKDSALIMHPAFEGGGGGFVSNPADLARWMALFSEGKVFPVTLLTDVRRGVPAGQLDVGANALSGLGVEIVQTPIGTAYGHGGFFPGYLSLALWYPERGVAVAIQVNSSASNALDRPLREVLLEAAVALTDTTRSR